MENNHSNLFSKNEGWLITKNEKGKHKLATCKGDETNIYEKTRDWIVTSSNETRLDALKQSVPELYKIGQFFISDLLNAENKEDIFTCKGINFCRVIVCGTVVSAFTKGENYWIDVDDTTSKIMCIISTEKLANLHNLTIDSTEVCQLFQENSTSKILQAAVLLTQSNTRRANLIPSSRDSLELGSIVKIIGQLKEYNGNRYIFISKIIKEPTDSVAHYQHLENLIYLYTENYGDSNL